MRGHPLQHGRGRLLVADPIGNPYRPIGRYGRVLRIGAENAGISHAVSRLPHLHFGANGMHLARRLLPLDKRRLGRIAPFAKVDVDEVHAHRRHLHHDFVRLWFRDGKLGHLQHFRTAKPWHLNRFHDRQ